MIWLYWTSFGLLVGAELNAELAKESEGLQPKAITSAEREHETDITLHNRAVYRGCFLRSRRSKPGGSKSGVIPTRQPRLLLAGRGQRDR